MSVDTSKASPSAQLQSLIAKCGPLYIVEAVNSYDPDKLKRLKQVESDLATLKREAADLAQMMLDHTDHYCTACKPAALKVLKLARKESS